MAILWLASYPKSGNTWFRIFLRHLQQDGDGPTFAGGSFSIASNREMFDEFSGLCSSDMTHEEIDAIRPRVYEAVAAQANGPEPVFIKTHDAYTVLPNGEPLLARKVSLGAICFVRNPLDVAISFAHHDGHHDIDRSIEFMISGHLDDTCERLNNQLRQQMFGWSGHVKSWVNADLPTFFLRYEDMIADAHTCFSAALQFAGLSYPESAIDRALELSSLDKLRALEAQEGFSEKPPHCQSFFRRGQPGEWKETLSEGQINRILADHGEMMRHFGYLDAGSKPRP